MLSSRISGILDMMFLSLTSLWVKNILDSSNMVRIFLTYSWKLRINGSLSWDTWESNSYSLWCYNNGSTSSCGMLIMLELTFSPCTSSKGLSLAASWMNCYCDDLARCSLYLSISCCALSLFTHSNYLATFTVFTLVSPVRICTLIVPLRNAASRFLASGLMSSLIAYVPMNTKSLQPYNTVSQSTSLTSLIETSLYANDTVL